MKKEEEEEEGTASRLKEILDQMTHPFAVESGDLSSSIDNLVTADALADDELQDCVAAVAPTTFWAALFRRPIFSVCRCPNVTTEVYRCQCEVYARSWRWRSLLGSWTALSRAWSRCNASCRCGRENRSPPTLHHLPYWQIFLLFALTHTHRPISFLFFLAFFLSDLAVLVQAANNKVIKQTIRSSLSFSSFYWGTTKDSLLCFLPYEPARWVN